MRDGKREILIGAVGLVKGSVRNGGRAMVAVCDELEPEFEQTGFLSDAPFKVVSLVLRYGTKWGEPDLGKINKRHSELEVGIELPISELRIMDEASLNAVVKKAALEALVATAQKYDLDGGVWENQLASLP
jgi:hypothetical protein